MEEVVLDYNYYCKSDEQIEKARKYLQPIVDECNDNGGYLFIKFTKGQRKGSIAKLYFDKEFFVENYYNGYQQHTEVKLSTHYGVLKWDGRKNKPQGHLGGRYNREVVWLKGYKGETIWNLVNANDEKKKALENDIQKDIDGNDLKIGDKVVYINARYGSGMMLCFGKIDRFEAVYDKSDSTVHINTIVKMKDNGMESNVSRSEEFIYKI